MARIRAGSALGAVDAAALWPNDFDPATVHEVIVDAAVAMLSY